MKFVLTVAGALLLFLGITGRGKAFWEELKGI